ANGAEDLTGFGGNDTFLYNAANASDDTITDFTKASTGDEQDFLDFSDLLTGYDAGTDDLSQFLNVSQVSTDTLIKVDKDGAGGYSDMTLTLKDELTTLSDLQASGQLIL
ncbi:MAG TPA: type I secretion C-terminal target domain-containing protein, partial [Methylococcaceae bacterium]|nr:type I secretion C-terminal target domain-containing protein [Methylococcaceae bacterium]